MKKRDFILGNWEKPENSEAMFIRSDLCDNTTALGLLSKRQREVLLESDEPLEMLVGNNKWMPLSPGESLDDMYTYRLAHYTPMVIPWESISEQWVWAVKDRAGMVWLTTSEPHLGTASWFFYGDLVTRVDNLIVGIEPGTVPWELTKQKRP